MLVHVLSHDEIGRTAAISLSLAKETSFLGWQGVEGPYSAPARAESISIFLRIIHWVLFWLEPAVSIESVLGSVYADQSFIILHAHSLQCIDIIGIVALQERRLLVKVSRVDILTLDHLEQVVALGRRDHILELGRVHYGRGHVHDFISRIVVGAWRNKCAFGTASMHQKFTLKVDSRPFQLLESLLFQQLPNVILVQTSSPGDKFALI